MDVTGLTVDDVACIFDYWQDSPPVNELVAAYMGVKPKQRGPAKGPTIAGLMAALGGTRG